MEARPALTEESNTLKLKTDFVNNQVMVKNIKTILVVHQLY
jgi:hypothetical protein